MSENRWYYVPDGEIIIDFSDCKYVGDYHDKLKAGFGFPDYYGRNWDALWDCLRDFALSEETKREVVIRGISQMPNELQEYAKKGCHLFGEMEKNYPNIHFIFTE